MPGEGGPPLTALHSLPDRLLIDESGAELEGGRAGRGQLARYPFFSRYESRSATLCSTLWPFVSSRTSALFGSS